ncbi:MAG: 1-deoxy-D-xylulose-5-phosphate reductoisomerase [Oscillospiraceae bacterium]|nr:1-deoxy-D-xylulose-5-phosphate reductoisomerase [Oscillospiraceae bacterium]
MNKSITILGSTGSIGRQSLEVIEHLNYSVCALSADKNIDLLEKQIRKFKPKFVAVYDKGAAHELKTRINDTTTTVLSEMKGQIEVAGNSNADVIVTAIAGQAGLEPTIAALKTGKRIALANKEPLVCAGELVMQTAKEHGAEIIPVDSEHSAIFQCLDGKKYKSGHSESSALIGIPHINKLILTASGGPFRGMTHEQLENITPEQALMHPNWDMGAKITIDSATMMNKGLELIEAMHLFDISPDKIKVVVHPESIVHSMVEFADGSTIAQLSNPDMRQPIQYALTYPARLPSLTKSLDLTELGKLTFEQPNMDTFPCLRLAYEAAEKGQTACASLNQANEDAVELFLNKKIGFNDIPRYIGSSIAFHK